MHEHGSDRSRRPGSLRGWSSRRLTASEASSLSTPPPATLGLAALIAGLVLAVGTVLLVASYWLLAVRLPGQFQAPQLVVPTSAGEARSDAGQTDPAAEVLGPPHPSGSSVRPPGDGDVGGTREGVVTLVEAAVARSTQHLQAEYRSEYLRWSLPLLAGLTAASIAVGWAAARRALRPVAVITVLAHQFSEDTIEHRMPVAGPRELRDLAQTLNGMLDRLESALPRERRLMANVSHELRTPIANQRMALAVALADPDAPAPALRRTAQTALAQNRRTSHLIEQILLLAQVDALSARPSARARSSTDHEEAAGPGQSPRFVEPVDLARVLRGAVRAQHSAGEGADVRIDLSLEHAPALGDPVLLERLAANLIGNASRYNDPNGWVHVRTFVADGRAVLRVENPGPAIADDEVRGLLEPFRRGGGSAPNHGNPPDPWPGVGLGLSIVEAIVRVHHGNLSLEPRPGGGLIVTVSLRAATAVTSLSR